MNPAHPFSLLADYNQWMNTNVYAAAKALPQEELVADKKAFFGSILGTLTHIMRGDILWLQRFKAHPARYPGLQTLPTLTVPQVQAMTFTNLEDWYQRRSELDTLILLWVASIQADDLSHVLPYTNMLGQPFARNFGGLILHFFNHQTHHRGQVTTLLTQSGVDVGVTDLAVRVPNVE